MVILSQGGDPGAILPLTIDAHGPVVSRDAAPGRSRRLRWGPFVVGPRTSIPAEPSAGSPRGSGKNYRKAPNAGPRPEDSTDGVFARGCPGAVPQVIGRSAGRPPRDRVGPPGAGLLFEGEVASRRAAL